MINRAVIYSVAIAVMYLVPLKMQAQVFDGSQQCPPGGMGMGFGGLGIMPYGGIFNLLFMVLFWGSIIVGFVYLIKYVSRSGVAGGNTKASLESILKERYAKGEITKEEFEEKKKELLK